MGSPALALTPSVSGRVSVEAGSTIAWDCQVGASGEKIAMRGFGASAPIADLLKEFWFTRETLVAAARRQLDFPEKSP
jgi:transketolase